MSGQIRRVHPPGLPGASTNSFSDGLGVEFEGALHPTHIHHLESYRVARPVCLGVAYQRVGELSTNDCLSNVPSILCFTPRFADEASSRFRFHLRQHRANCTAGSRLTHPHTRIPPELPSRPTAMSLFECLGNTSMHTLTHTVREIANIKFTSTPVWGAFMLDNATDKSSVPGGAGGGG